MQEGTEAIHEALSLYGYGCSGVSLELAAERLLRDLQRVVRVEMKHPRKPRRKSAKRAA